MFGVHPGAADHDESRNRGQARNACEPRTLADAGYMDDNVGLPKVCSEDGRFAGVANHRCRALDIRIVPRHSNDLLALGDEEACDLTARQSGPHR